MKKLITTLTILAAGATLALAQDAPATNSCDHHPGPGGPRGRHGRMNPEAFFKKLDTNNDGSISAEEFEARPRARKNPERAKERFKKLDTGGNGSLSLDELKAGHYRPKGGEHQDEGAPNQ
jgi:hypothetical protein